MATPDPPILLIVPGAFGLPSGFDKLKPYLSAAGLATAPGPYPSCNPADPTKATCEADIASLRNDVLLPLIEQHQGRRVVIVAHSYGGVVAGGAAKGLDEGTRKKQGLAGGVVGLIYIAGNITLEGETLLEAVGGAYPPFIKLGKPAPGLALIEPAMAILYNDCDPALAPQLEATLQPHAHLAFETKASAPAWADAYFDGDGDGGRRTYVRTAEDCCTPPAVQDALLAKTGVRWDVVRLEGGHMPFVSRPEELAGVLVRAVAGMMSGE